MTMTGDCHIEHESNGDNKPFTLRCQEIVADLEPVPTTQPSTQPTTDAATLATTQPTTLPATVAMAGPTTAPATTSPAEASANQKMRLKHVVAQDQVEFISSPIHFEASSIDYDPNTHLLIAKGTDRVRAQLYDEKGTVAGEFEELYYNTQTGRIDHTVNFRSTVRK
jgi:hypothetical protein